MYFQSIRFRLTLWYVAILALILCSFSGFLYLTLSRSLHQYMDAKIKSIADFIAASYSSPYAKYGRNLDRLIEEATGMRPTGKFIQVLDGKGRIGLKSGNLGKFQLPISRQASTNAAKGRLTYETNRTIAAWPIRIVTVPIVEGRLITNIVQVGSSLEDVEKALKTLLLILSITIPSLLAVASLGGHFLANRALRPVDEVSNTARAITSHNLNRRIRIKKTKDEIGRLAETFNEMISRLDESFRKTRQFSADASHELKTPLTVLKGEIEVALRRARAGDEYRAILGSNLEEINNMTRIVDDLLLLSRADSGEVPLTKSTVDLSDFLSEIQVQAQLLATSRSIDVYFHDNQKVFTLADPLRLKSMMLNLVENGIKYSLDGGRIDITLEQNDGFAVITVTDQGIGIPQEALPHIFDRFFRVDKARSRQEGGSGLGLSICKWIAEAHGGSISAKSELGKGSAFIVRIPSMN
ncbi:MAG: heavy metal sensor histidine kinase [Proteobacteria bacterium]|nr:heavy metal sensor histidine kinase [Pseudomonadota bacterium]